MSPFLVGVAGGTASGKTTITVQAAAILGATVVTHDRYYKDASDPRHHDFDAPEALDTALLIAHLHDLRAGRPIEAPIYDFATHTRVQAVERIQPTPLILVEGILVLADFALRQAFDFTAFVHADDDVRLGRRIRRDTAERGRTWDDVLRQWFVTVRPSHKRWVAPSRDLAHVVLDGEGEVDVEVARLVGEIRAAANGGLAAPPAP